MNFTVVIPARYASQRLPGKPLCDIAGKTMIERVYLCAKKSLANNVIVATDHPDIVKEVESFGGKVCLTSSAHESGTDRLAEVVETLSLDDDHIVVNVQGDEPLIPAAVINQVARNLHQNKTYSASTLSEPIDLVEDLFNPNVVKVISNKSGRALYFSRATIPWDRDGYLNQSSITEKQLSNSDCPAQRHIGIYAYRVNVLKDFVSWSMSTLEKIERLEQLRILDNDKQIYVEPACESVPGGVDTPEDLERLRKFLKSNA